jgi:hypothetical protein
MALEQGDRLLEGMHGNLKGLGNRKEKRNYGTLGLRSVIWT